MHIHCTYFNYHIIHIEPSEIADVAKDQSVILFYTADLFLNKEIIQLAACNNKYAFIFLKTLLKLEYCTINIKTLTMLLILLVPYSKKLYGVFILQKGDCMAIIMML